MPDMSLPQVPPAQPAAKASRAPDTAAATAKDSPPDQEFSGVLEDRLKAGGGGDTAAGAAGRTTGDKETSAAADGKVLPSAGNAADALIAALDADADVDADSGLVNATAGEVPAADLEQPTVPVAAAAPVAVVPVPEAAGQGWLQARPVAGPAMVPSPPDSHASGVAQAVQDILRDAGSAVPDASQDVPAAERLGAEIRLLAQAQAQSGGAGARAAGLDTVFDRSAALPPQPAGVAAAASAPQDPAVRPTLPTTAIDVPLRQPGWDQALGDRVMWVVNQKFQGAEIKLNPPQLGPIEVRIQMHHDQAQVTFTAQHGAVRDALEAALPRLREMFAANGVGLGDVNVSQHSFAEQQRHMYGSADGKFRAAFGGGADDEVGAPLEQGISHAGVVARSGIDLFA